MHFQFLLALGASLLCSLPQIGAAGEANVQTMDLTVDGVARTALVYVPPQIKAGEKVPLVFVFHGHGGHTRAALKEFQLAELWPEAISVYPEGLPIPGMFHDPEGKQPGWQNDVGQVGDRDVHFFDAMLAKLEKDHPIDPTRIYCTGHSNGAFFTFALWKARPEIFAAVASCSGTCKYAADLKPKPALIMGGRNDKSVTVDLQQGVVDALKKVNGCAEAGTPWEKVGTAYASKNGMPVVSYFHDGGHPMNEIEPGLLVKFFKQNIGSPAAPKPAA